ncbi:hypothetical protein [Streptomyces wuyuanensis]|uniref:hypothetical protein n=1 Tax=Streptomyces wuyuanensis TaxID=1196353 RepID=UPI00343EBD93
MTWLEVPRPHRSKPMDALLIEPTPRTYLVRVLRHSRSRQLATTIDRRWAEIEAFIHTDHSDAKRKASPSTAR